jgi:hypothetical protein
LSSEIAIEDNLDYDINLDDIDLHMKYEAIDKFVGIGSKVKSGV